MVFNVPMDNLSSIPISYHLARASYKAPLTSLRSSTVSCPEGIDTSNVLGSSVNAKCMVSLASFPGLCAAFGCTKERGGPGMFPHVRDVEGRKVVERT